LGVPRPVTASHGNEPPMHILEGARADARTRSLEGLGGRAKDPMRAALFFEQGCEHELELSASKPGASCFCTPARRERCRRSPPPKAHGERAFSADPATTACRRQLFHHRFLRNWQMPDSRGRKNLIVRAGVRERDSCGRSRRAGVEVRVVAARGLLNLSIVERPIESARTQLR